jgi:mRNA-degrading endonuclease toxin of MazEF toxin-antitoxin module
LFNVELPRPSDERGRVQSGTRPCVILNASETLGKVPVVMIAPGTSNLDALRFPHTVRVDPDTTNGLTKATVFYGFQLQAADRRWIKRHLGRLSDGDFRRLEDEILNALGFDPPVD